MVDYVTRKTQVLITTVPPQAKGGIVALHEVLFDLPRQQDFALIPFQIASPIPFQERLASRLLRILVGINRFLFTLLRNRFIRIVHINTSPESKAILRDALLVLISRLLRRKVVLQIHGAVSDSTYPKMVRWTAFRAFSLCHRVLVFSQKDIRLIAGLVPHVPIQTFPNAIRTSDFRKGDQFFKNELAIPLENKIVLFLSRFLKEKGGFDLIESIPGVVSRFVNVSFVFAGDGPEFEQMKTACREKRLDHYVRFTGHLSYKDVVRVLTAADVFVLPTYWVEGMPTAILQALAAGLPVISTRAGGIPEVIQDGVHGFLVEPRAPAQLVDKILILLQNDTLRRQIGDTNVRLARDNFDIEVVSRDLEKLYVNL
jgi:glycosyltransferase involved in cell wall biosynthesis